MKSGCAWSTGADALDAMIDIFGEEGDIFENFEAKENVFAIGMKSGVKEDVYKGSLYAMAGVGAVGLVMFVVYKRRKISTQVVTANTSLGEDDEKQKMINEYGSI